MIRKRGETSCLPSCVPAAHSREYAVMIWHTRRAEVVNRASLARRVVAPYGEVLQAASYSRARNARPYEIWTQRLARRGRGPGQLLLPLRGNSPSRALRNRAAIHLPAPLRTQWHRPTGAQCAPLRGVNSRRCAEIVAPYRVQKVDGALLPTDDALQRKKRQPKLSLFYAVITAYLRAIAFLAASTM